MSRDSALAQANAVPTSVTRAHAEHAIRTFLASYAAKDVDTRIELFADDIIFEDPAGAEPVRGKADLDSFFRATIGNGWDIAMESEKIIKSGNEALSFTRAEWGLSGTEPARLTLVQNFAFDAAGKIIKLRIFFDETTIT
jgi:ketosteroid isomerase-like protein